MSDILKTKTIKNVTFTLAKTSKDMATVFQMKDGQRVEIFAGNVDDCKRVFQMLGKTSDTFKFNISTGDSYPR